MATVGLRKPAGGEAEGGGRRESGVLIQVASCFFCQSCLVFVLCLPCTGTLLFESVVFCRRKGEEPRLMGSIDRSPPLPSRFLLGALSVCCSLCVWGGRATTGALFLVVLARALVWWVCFMQSSVWCFWPLCLVVCDGSRYPFAVAASRARACIGCAALSILVHGGGGGGGEGRRPVLPFAFIIYRFVVFLHACTKDLAGEVVTAAKKTSKQSPTFFSFFVVRVFFLSFGRLSLSWLFVRPLLSCQSQLTRRDK